MSGKTYDLSGIYRKDIIISTCIGDDTGRAIARVDDDKQMTLIFDKEGVSKKTIEEIVSKSDFDAIQSLLDEGLAVLMPKRDADNLIKMMSRHKISAGKPGKTDDEKGK